MRKFNGVPLDSPYGSWQNFQGIGAAGPWQLTGELKHNRPPPVTTIHHPSRSLELLGTRPNSSIASALNNSSLGATSGDAGSVIVTAGQMVADQAVIFAATEGRGQAGAVQLQVDTLEARASTISAASFGAGDTGDVVIQGRRVALTGGSEVGTLGLGSGRVGDVQVLASEGLTVQGRSPSGETPSRITESS